MIIRLSLNAERKVIYIGFTPLASRKDPALRWREWGADVRAAPGEGGRLAPCFSKHEKMPLARCQWVRAGLGISILSMAAVWSSFPAKSWRITLTRSSSSTQFHFAPFSPVLLLIHCSLSLIAGTPAPSCTKVLFFVLSFH